MNKLQKIKRTVALDKGFTTWDGLLKWGQKLPIEQLDSIYDEVAERYAQETNKNKVND